MWPLPRWSAVGTVVYLVSMTFDELPAPALLWAVAATLLAVADGDLATPLGVVAAVLVAVVAAGLLLVTWRAVRSRAVPERSLDDALGTRWRADIAPHLAAGLRTHPPIVRGLLLPLLRSSVREGSGIGPPRRPYGAAPGGRSGWISDALLFLKARVPEDRNCPMRRLRWSSALPGPVARAHAA